MVISVIFGAPGGPFFRASDGFRNLGGVSEIWGGDSFVFCHHPTQRGCLIFTALALKRLPTWPLVETKLARPIRSQDFKTSINSILPHTIHILVSPVNSNAWCTRSISDSGLFVKTVMEDQL